MSDDNPLVADRVDTTSPFAGAYLLQDGEDIAHAISSGDWAAGALAVASTALDTVGAIIDPIGTLIANGLGWVLDHIEPLKSWFNDFTGDAAEVASFSGTWANTSGYLARLADSYQGTLPSLDGMAGDGIDAYLAHANIVIAHLRGSADWSSAMAAGLQVASTLVQMVHDIIRDVLSQLVGSAISAAATTAATIGFGAPAAMAQFGVKVSALVAKVGRIIPRVLDALAELQRLLRRLGPAIETAIHKIGQLLRGAPSTPHTPHTPTTPHSPDVGSSPNHPPGSHDPDAPRRPDEPNGNEPDDDWGVDAEPDLRPDLQNPGGHDGPYRPRPGDADGGPGQWGESPRTEDSRGMPFQIEHTGVAPSETGRVLEYRLDSPHGGNPVDFDNYTHRGDPPIDVFQEYKGDYSILEQPWLPPTRREEIINDMLAQAERQHDAINSATHGGTSRLEWFFKDQAAADLFQQALYDAGMEDLVEIFVLGG